MAAQVVLLASGAEVDRFRQMGADDPQSLFGVEVTTFPRWIEGLWARYGDGRAIVGRVQRRMLLTRLVRERREAVLADGLACARQRGATSGSAEDDAASGGRLADAAAIGDPPSGDIAWSPGFVRFADRVLQVAAGLPALEDLVARGGASASGSDWPDNQGLIVDLLRQYAAELRGAGLVEGGEAAQWLAVNAPCAFPAGLRVRHAGGTPLTWHEQAFFERLPHVRLQVDPLQGADVLAPVRAGVRLSFAFPAGAYARPALLAQTIERLAPDHDVVVACADPVGLFEALAPGLQRPCFAQGARPYRRTSFGGALIALHEAIAKPGLSDAERLVLLCDVLRSPFAGLSQKAARSVEQQVRGDRLTRFDDVLAEVRAASELFSQLEEVATQPGADVLLGVFEDRARRMTGRGGHWVADELAAIAATRQTCYAAYQGACTVEDCIGTLREATVSVARSAGEGLTAPTVRIMGRTAAACLPPSAVHTVIACGFEQASLPLGGADDAVTLFLERCGLTSPDDPLAAQRRMVQGLEAAARCNLVVERLLRDESADEAYPAAVFEELVDAYRDDPTNVDELRNEHRLPACLDQRAFDRGEDLLVENECRGPRLEAVALANSCEREPDDPLHAAAVSQLRAVGRLDGGLIPSPSALEAYVECPRKWLITRGFRTDGLDEGFGPAERGTFAHRVLELLYSRLAERGVPRIVPAGVDEAASLLREAAAEVEAEQAALKPGSRLAARTLFERKEVHGLVESMVRHLPDEAALLPRFRPLHLEYQISRESPVSYAGGLLAGRIDRIDVDDQGNAVVIDYKSSVSDEHSVGFWRAHQTGKVQALVYARAVERALGLNVVGSLYVRAVKAAGPVVAGALDPRFAGPADLPGSKADAVMCDMEGPLSFRGLVDEVEQRVAYALECLRAGDVAPRPSWSGVCASCPLSSCPRREN
ncbi:PD-(D/E)XK nuclease family protein [Berryella wangjianweii]|uniref:PD-(D/E)XK nuclease family protein n=1 Tax=Berryella wangjianweii TaxID=2734634 RepID=A0A6M8J1F1_9ACTN|nr:PD-(D/E)XK nuclease family protein [Berryella wangjianweii]QKF07437.1 PD-(D/E)XK nuclease family protein [Berryella wangjianweii]